MFHGVQRKPSRRLTENWTAKSLSILRNKAGLAFDGKAYYNFDMGATKMVGGWPSTEGLRPSDYIETCKGIWRKEGKLMSDFEMLSIVLIILGIIVTLVIALINTKK